MSELQYFNDVAVINYPLSEVIANIADGTFCAGTVLFETRPPVPDDLTPDFPTLFEAVHECIGLAMYEGFTALHHDNGAPDFADLETGQNSTEGIALRDALAAYLRAHTDLSDAAWQRTGRVLRVLPEGGYVIEEGPW